MSPLPRSASVRVRLLPLAALALTFAALSAGLAGCGGSDALTESRAVASVAFAAPADTMVVGTREQLHVILRDQDGGQVTGPAVAWETTDSSVATVSPAGLATALRVGATDVHVFAAGRSASLRLVVRPVPVATLAFVAPPTELPAGSVVQLVAVTRDQVGAQLNGRAIAYRSSAAQVASVSATGVLTALADGEATITAECEGRAASFTVRVSVVPVAAIELVPAAVAVPVGQAVQLYATLRDAAGRPLPSRPVAFRATDPLVATVDAGGVVRGVSVGSAQVVAELEGRSATAPVTVSDAPTVAPPPPLPDLVPAPPLPTGAGDGSYSIRVSWVGTPDARASAAMDAVVARWRALIAGDLPDVPVTLEADDCMEGQGARSETVDDLLVFVRTVDIDGAGGTLARAGPCFVRRGSGLPIVGMVELDEADLARSPDVVQSVLTHEFGHVLGIGTLWEYLGLLHGKGSDDPRFLGAEAHAAYAGLGGLLTLVPVENEGGRGTRDGHWREALFRTELMTGWINAGHNPLSTMTVAALRDLGYAVRMDRADPYTLPAAGLARPSLAGPVGIPMGEELVRPRFDVDATGRTRRLPER